MSPKRAIGRRCPVTRSQWDKMLAAYRERPTIQHVMDSGQCGKRAARRAILEGWPDHGYPPFVELGGEASSIHKEMSVFRETWAEADVTRGEAARQAAEEAMAARISMDAALKASRLAQGYAAKVLEKLEQDPDSMIPDNITPKIVLQLCTSLEKSAIVVEKAMKVEQMRAGKPEAVLGVEIGILIDRCSNDELELVAQSGELPARIIDTRRNIHAMAATAETDAESAARQDVEDAPDEEQDDSEDTDPDHARDDHGDTDAARAEDRANHGAEDRDSATDGLGIDTEAEAEGDEEKDIEELTLEAIKELEKAAAG